VRFLLSSSYGNIRLSAVFMSTQVRRPRSCSRRWARASTCSTPSVMRSWCNARVTRLTSGRGLTYARRSGAKLSWWYHGADGSAGELNELEQILTKDTKIVALCHVSNLLGEIIDLPAVVKLVRSRASRDCQIVVDGVAYAPHRPIKVSEWGVDWYVHLNISYGQLE